MLFSIFWCKYTKFVVNSLQKYDKFVVKTPQILYLAYSSSLAIQAQASASAKALWCMVRS